MIRNLLASPMLSVVLFLSPLCLGASRAIAQEDVNSAPPPLQWPSDVSAHPSGAIPFQLTPDDGLRHQIEDAGNAELCKALMKDANVPIPNEANFTYADCPASFKATVSSGSGKFSWADGARPTQCGRSCLGPPFMMQTQNTNRPNVRYAMVYGSLTFHVDVPGPFNRDVYYGLELDVTCDIPNDLREGIVHITSHLDGPVASDPSIFETVTNFIALPFEISQRITDGINSTYGTTTSPVGSRGSCSSMGANASPPADWKFDSFNWDVPTPRRRPTMADITTASPTATLYFDRIFRNRTIESNPSTGPMNFTVYINGRPAHIPHNNTVSLAPGASYDQRFCATAPMDGVNNLQVLFVDSLGGAVWSQFTNAQNFGSGGAHKMTTGRTFLMPARRPGDKPTTTLVREFELDYRIDYHGAPAAVATTQRPQPAGVKPRQPARVFAPPRGAIPDSACTKI